MGGEGVCTEGCGSGQRKTGETASASIAGLEDLHSLQFTLKGQGKWHPQQRGTGQLRPEVEARLGMGTLVWGSQHPQESPSDGIGCNFPGES